MASRIKGITIEIGGDTTKLDKALAGTNKELHNTQNNLRDVERLLKLDPKNTVLLEQQQRLLGDAVAGTKMKLETLKDAATQAGEAMKKGAMSIDQYDALQREIIATESDLKNLEERAKKASGGFREFGDAMDKVSSKAAAVADKTKGISVAAGAAVTGLGTLAVKAGAAADDLNTLSKQSGFSTDTLQKWQYASDIVDVSVDDIIGAARKMKKNMDSTSADVVAAWEKIGIWTRDTSGNFRDAESVFYDTIGALSQIPNETERDIIAMQLFGKSADDLAGIIDDGGKALRDLGKEAEDAGLILSQDALDGANAFNDGVDRIKARSKAAFTEAGASLAENLLPKMDALVQKVTDLVLWFANLDEKQMKMIIGAFLLIAAISPLAKTIEGIATVTKMAVEWFSKMDIKTAAILITVGLLTEGIISMIRAWDDMSGLEKVLSVLGAIMIAAAGVAIAIGAVKGAVAAALTAAAILAGYTMIKLAVGNANSRAGQRGDGGFSDVPALADGAVLPANKPFLAMVGDQKRGTNIEAPMDTIKQGVREVMSEGGSRGGSTDVNVRFTGSMSQLVRALKPEIEIETGRAGPSARTR